MHMFTLSNEPTRVVEMEKQAIHTNGAKENALKAKHANSSSFFHGFAQVFVGAMANK